MKILTEEKELRSESYTINWHSHAFWQLDYYPEVKGGNLELDAMINQIKPGFVCLIPPGIRHRIEIVNPIRDYSIKFDSDDPLFLDNIHFTIIPFPEYSEVLGKLFMEEQNENELDVRMKENYMNILLLKLLKKRSIFPDSGGMKDSRIKNTVAFIRTNFLKKLDLDILAGKAGLSKYHFIKLFQKETGTTPFQYIQDLKLEKAISLLRFSDYNISQISDALGFPDIQTFSRAFKNKMRRSPLNYRKTRS